LHRIQFFGPGPEWVDTFEKASDEIVVAPDLAFEGHCSIALTLLCCGGMIWTRNILFDVSSLLFCGNHECGSLPYRSLYR